MLVYGTEELETGAIVGKKLAAHPSPLIGIECVCEVESLPKKLKAYGAALWPTYLCRICEALQVKETLIPHLESEDHRLKYLVRGDIKGAPYVIIDLAEARKSFVCHSQRNAASVHIAHRPRQ